MWSGSGSMDGWMMFAGNDELPPKTTSNQKYLVPGKPHTHIASCA
jgi:hypothetical protein